MRWGVFLKGVLVYIITCLANEACGTIYTEGRTLLWWSLNISWDKVGNELTPFLL